MNKEKKPRSIEVKERVKLKIGDKEYEFESNTPTTGFYTDLYDEITAGYDATEVFPLNKIQVLDSAGSVGAEITSANWTLTKGTAKITISGSATWNSDNPPAKLKILDTRGVAYFETSLPAGVSAQRGLPITITWEASFSIAISSATGYLAGSHVLYTVYLDKLVDILANEREGKSLSIRKASYYYTDGYEWVVNVIGEMGQHYLRIPPTQVPKAGSINQVLLCTSADICMAFVLSSPLNVNAGDYVSLDIYFV
jgi:hypothetical protein